MASISSSNTLPRCPTDRNNPPNSQEQHSSHPLMSSTLPLDPLAGSLTTASDFSIPPAFNTQKKATLSMGLPFPGQDLRTSVYPKASALPFGADPVNNFDLEYALLEHALSRDGTSDGLSALPTRQEKKAVTNATDTDFYFTDLLGESNLQSQPLTGILMQEELPGTSAPLYPTVNVTEVKEEVLLDEAAMESHLSSALATLAGSNNCLSTRKCNEEVRETTQTKLQKTSHKEVTTPVYTLNGNIPNNCNKVASWEMPFGSSGTSTDCEEEEEEGSASLTSPQSDSSTSNIGTHPDLYENLSPRIRAKVDELQTRISGMPRRKLRESLAAGVTMEDVEPLMVVNRDELAGMLGLGVTTWKMFVHHTLGVPRWPARALKSQKVKVGKVRERIREARNRGDWEGVKKAERELQRIREGWLKRGVGKRRG